MKKLIMLIAGFLFIAACEQDSGLSGEALNSIYTDTPITTQTTQNENRKIDICHNGHINNVSINAMSAHHAHGDAMDVDGDGYFTTENPCSLMVEDCDDDPLVNPGMEEICFDGIDNNCNGEIDENC